MMYVFTQLVYGYELRYIFEVFYFNAEASFPTVYSVSALLFASLLLLIVGAIRKGNGKPFAKQWIILGVIFFLLAYDEAAQIHEKFKFIRDYLPSETMGFLYFAWVVPYFGLVVVVGLYFIRFLRHLPKRTATLFIAAGFIFVGGAVGMELLNSYYWKGSRAMLLLVITLEELMEMFGVVLLIYGVLDFMKNEMGNSVKIMVEKAAIDASSKKS